MKAHDLDRISNSSKSIETILFRIARFIEEEYELQGARNYWDERLIELPETERVFYKIWAWLSYIENEYVIPGILKEISEVFGEETYTQLLEISQKSHEQLIECIAYLKLSGPLGEQLLNWLQEKLK